MSKDNSDYKKLRTQMHKLLPEPLQSDLNNSVFENLYNRFLTKQETNTVAGYIGKGNATPLVNRNIQEDDIHRQGNQLQPIMHQKVGSVDYMMNWKDVLNELERTGVDVTKLPYWGSVESFNWVPPVDLDKLVNYRDYYWYNPGSPGSYPDYITIRNQATTARARVSFWQNIIKEIGESMPVVKFKLLDTTVPEPVKVKSITVASNTIIVDGELTIGAGATLLIMGTNKSNGDVITTTASVYDKITNTTAITVEAGKLTHDEALGFVKPYRFNAFEISNNVARFFGKGFVFFYRDSTNRDLNNTWITVESSVYNTEKNKTVVKLASEFTSPILDGVVSLKEQLNAQSATLNCIETGSAGWDNSGLDDNSTEWKLESKTFLDSIKQPNVPTGTANNLDMVWVTSTDALYQFGTDIGWKLIYNSFSMVVKQNTTGDESWDSSNACGKKAAISSANQWIESNKWVHKSDVPNFSIAKQAKHPIIEYSWSLELNEWSHDNLVWKYRKDNNSKFAATDKQPHLFELKEIKVKSIDGNTITLSDSHGDLTDWFTVGQVFQDETRIPRYTVTSSEFMKAADGSYNMVIGLDNASELVVDRRLFPNQTSLGDAWKEYNVHWLFIGRKDTVPVNHQNINPRIAITNTTVVDEVEYSYIMSPFAQEFTKKTTNNVPFVLSNQANGSDQSINTRSMVGMNDTRVYINNKRIVGTYDELSEKDVTGAGDESFVYAIKFIDAFAPNQFDIVRVEVGASTVEEIGMGSVPVRMIEDNQAFIAALAAGEGTVKVSLITNRLAEQTKTKRNQYPLFDIYNTDGTTAHKANEIFGFAVSATSEPSPDLGLRAIIDKTTHDYKFEQHLVESDNGRMFAYRDFLNGHTKSIYIETLNAVWFWNDTGWCDSIDMGGVIRTAVIDENIPSAARDIKNGVYWYNPSNKSLMLRDAGEWVTVDTFSVVKSDPTLQTIWKKGATSKYVPQKRDWKNRSLEEYNTERDLFLENEERSLTLSSKVDASHIKSEALKEWYKTQTNKHSSTGEWKGDWEIPEPMYFNSTHENHKVVTLRELQTHFSTIITKQKKIAGFTGAPESMFHLIPMNDIDFGIGGKIKEFNGSFDTFLSSVFVNNVTPLTLIDFAHDQYDALTNTLIENFKENLSGYITDLRPELFNDFIGKMVETIIAIHENDAALGQLYGDSHTQNGSKGIANWISTLPFIGVGTRVKPTLSVDDVEATITHHDGHRKSYKLNTASAEIIIQRAVRKIDVRTGDTKDTFGRTSSEQPPATFTDFALKFKTSVDNRNGSLWYFVEAGHRTLYRLNAVAAGANEPSSNFPDGSLWICTKQGQEGLRIKSSTGATVYWNAIDGTALGEGKLHNGAAGDITQSTVSAWTKINLNQLLGEIIYNVEMKLWETAPATSSVNIDDFITSQDDKAHSEALLKGKFLAYIRDKNVSAFANVHYEVSNPWTWNYRNSSPGSSFEIINANKASGTFTIQGDHSSNFFDGMEFSIKNSFGNDGKFKVSTVTIAAGDTVIKVTTNVVDSVQGVIYTGTLPSSNNTGGESGGYWKDLYQKIYGTPVPHLEPWVLQGYTDKPSWWDAEYLNTDTSSHRRWKYNHATKTGMWENIQKGIIPVGKILPKSTSKLSTGVAGEAINTFKFMSVNINDSIMIVNATAQYKPDELLPPFVNHIAAGEDADSSSRSIFSNFGGEIVSPGADYAFGDAGEVEYQWRTSSQYLYDKLAIAYTLQPIKFMDLLFGTNRNVIGGLNLDKDSGRVSSHRDTIFHGEIVGDKVIKVAGLNQWYVNYNRYSGYDSNLADFRSLWVDWTVKLGYHFSSFIDTDSLDVAHRKVDITSSDYNVLAKKSHGASSAWLESFDVSVIHQPAYDARFDAEVNYEFRVDTPSPLNRVISYYDVQNYQFNIDPATNLCSIYTYPVKVVNAESNAFTITGNHTDIFTIGKLFNVKGSENNDKKYTVLSSVYDKTAKITIIKTKEGNNGTSQVVNGNIMVEHRTLPWQTGEEIWLSSSHRLPSPLEGDTIIGSTIYFIIRISDTEFKIANTKADAMIGNAINVTDAGEDNHFVGKLHSTFNVNLSGDFSTNWRHYVVDRSTVLTFTPPYEIRGMQNLINMVRGYEEYKADQGWGINVSRELTHDKLHGRLQSWQSEIESFIQTTYSLVNYTQQYDVTYSAAISNDALVFTADSEFVTGDAVKVTSSDVILPSPLVRDTKYYVIRINANTYRLAVDKLKAMRGEHINLVENLSAATLMVIKASDVSHNVPVIRINPFKEAVWYKPKYGVISNIITGPSDDMRRSQLIFDQQGNPLSQELLIMREDKISQITLFENRAQPTKDIDAEYPLSYIGGCHLFIDEFEHVMLFEKYSSSGVLLYDPFVGLNITKFEMIFERQTDFTKRPNIGGYYMSTFFNQGANIKRNIEASIDDHRHLYDTYAVNESSEMVRESRKILGYEGPRDYLSNLNLKEKSQFAFWRGMIQHKGAMNAVDTFINSRRFIDAKVDEFWAILVAEFGSSGEREYPEMFLQSTDARSNDLKIQFIGEDDYCYPGYDRNNYDSVTCGYDTPEDGNPVPSHDPDFIPVALTDAERWFNQPEQFEMLRDNGSMMFFNMKPTTHMKNVTWVNNPKPRVRHNFNADHVTVTVDQYDGQKVTTHRAPLSFTAGSKVISDLADYIPLTNSISVFKNGTQLDELVDYLDWSVDSGELFTRKISLVVPLEADDVITVSYGTATLLETVHYHNVNDNILELAHNELPTSAHLSNVQLWGNIADSGVNDPSKIIDKKAKTVISSVPVWHPGQGFHNQQAMHNVDIQNNDDPAIYTSTAETLQMPNHDKLYNSPWNAQEVGTTWLDTATLDYVAYSDKNVYPEVDTRLRLWGKLADWCNELKIEGEHVKTPTVYEWVKSDIHPSEWNKRAEKEEGDNSIEENVRKSGRVAKVLFELKAGKWVKSTPVIQEFDVAIEGNNVTLVGFALNDIVDVYSNGRLVKKDHKITSFTFNLDTVGISHKDADRIRVMKHIEKDQEKIDALVAAGTHKHEYLFTSITKVDAFNVEYNEYYFWVSSKTTRTAGRTMSPKTSMIQLASPSNPYMFFQGATLPTKMVTGVANTISQSWNHIINDDDMKRFAAYTPTIDNIGTNRQIFTFGTKAKAVASVTVNNALVAYTLSHGNRSIVIDASVVLKKGDEVAIRYTVDYYRDTYQMPAHFNKVVVRGLRGLVDEERRYIIRFTRDFTLRDGDDLNNVNILKSTHEEWRLFRREQPQHIDRALWNKVTESIVGYKLANKNVRVPSLDRELYDAKYHTDTSVGLGDGQAFTNGEAAMKTIMAYLTDPDNDFSPIDISDFFKNHSVDTPDNIVKFMNGIYNTFKFENVNHMFFDILLDSLANKREYAGIMKTSWLAVHGVKPFDVGGSAFDD